MSSIEVATNNTVTQVIEVPLHLIKPSKTNPRKGFDDLNDLANSIAKTACNSRCWCVRTPPLRALTTW